jgi:SAM-dependent methyltransferase
MASDRQRRFWDARAREAAFFFVDDRIDYRDPDLATFWAQGERDLDAILAALGITIGADERLVEIGCGVGRLTRVLASRAAHVDALDLSAEMLARARQHNPELENVSWIEGDGASLQPIADASADGVVSHVVFQHIPDPAVTLGYVREMGRVLRPGGWAAFQVSNDPRIHRPRTGSGRVAHVLRSLLGRAPRGQGDPAWLGSAVDLGDLRATAQAAGLDVERIEGAGTQFCLVALRRREA